MKYIFITSGVYQKELSSICIANTCTAMFLIPLLLYKTEIRIVFITNYIFKLVGA